MVHEPRSHALSEDFEFELNVYLLTLGIYENSTMQLKT